MAASRREPAPKMPPEDGRKTTKAVLPGARPPKPKGPKPVRLTAEQ